MKRPIVLYAISCVLLGIGIVWNIFLYTLPEKTTLANYLFNLWYALLFLYGGIIGIIGGIRLGIKSAIGRTLFHLGAGLFSWGIGGCIWGYYNVVLQVEFPYPGLADFFWILFIPLMVIGGWQLLSIVRTQMTKQYIAEATGIFLCACIALFGFIYKPELSSTAPLLENIFNTLYPLGDSVIIAFAYMVWRSSGGKIRRIASLLVFGLFVHVAADLTFTYTVARDTYWNGSISDIEYMLAGCILGWAVIDLYTSFRGETATKPS